jgi:hypothetical protein
MTRRGVGAWSCAAPDGNTVALPDLMNSTRADRSHPAAIIWKVAVLITPIAAGVIGYRYEGWLGALVNPIAAVVVCGFALMGALIASAWITFLRNRGRVSLLSDEQLEAITAKPSNPDFRFAFTELKSRGKDVRAIQRILIDMLSSSDQLERRIGLIRLREIHPDLRHFSDEPTENHPEQLKEQIQALLERADERK